VSLTVCFQFHAIVKSSKLNNSYNGVKRSLPDAQPKPDQVAYLTQKLGDLAKKARLRRTPNLYISKTERFASVNVFQNRISIGTHVLNLWQAGKFNNNDIDAMLAHEIGHLMDFRSDSKSASFRQLIFESLWLCFGVIPIVLYVLSPTVAVLAFSLCFAAGWGFSLPWIVRRVEVRIELEADRNAAMFLIEPKQLAEALIKIGSFSKPAGNLSFKGWLVFTAGILTHPTFSERVRFLRSLQPLKGVDVLVV
jgi:Zn-dependent protease with chaperone function